MKILVQYSDLSQGPEIFLGCLYQEQGGKTRFLKNPLGEFFLSHGVYLGFIILLHSGTFSPGFSWFFWGFLISINIFPILTDFWENYPNCYSLIETILRNKNALHAFLIRFYWVFYGIFRVGMFWPFLIRPGHSPQQQKYEGNNWSSFCI